MNKNNLVLGFLAVVAAAAAMLVASPEIEANAAPGSSATELWSQPVLASEPRTGPRSVREVRKIRTVREVRKAGEQ